MEKIVRVSTVARHEEARRDDIMKMPPSERVALLMRMRDEFFGDCEPISKVAAVRSVGGK